MVGNSASVYGAFLWPAADAPRYLQGGATIAGVCVLCAGGALAIRTMLARENRRLEQAFGRPGGKNGGEDGTMKGEGEGWQRTFRYIL